MLSKERKELLERLDRIFPHFEVWNEGYYLNDDKGYPTEDYSPPYKVDWAKILEVLEENGLTIKNKKE